MGDAEYLTVDVVAPVVLPLLWVRRMSESEDGKEGGVKWVIRTVIRRLRANVGVYRRNALYFGDTGARAPLSPAIPALQRW